MPFWCLFQACAKGFSCCSLGQSWGKFQALLSLPLNVRHVKCWAQAHNYVLEQINQILHFCRATGTGHVGAAILLQVWDLTWLLTHSSKKFKLEYFTLHLWWVKCAHEVNSHSYTDVFAHLGLQEHDPVFELTHLEQRLSWWCFYLPMCSAWWKFRKLKVYKRPITAIPSAGRKKKEIVIVMYLLCSSYKRNRTICKDKLKHIAFVSKLDEN